ncbi:MAG: helix-turn-helix transcriptional regulator [Rhodobacteraceae bacterium]|nr:helix-turn-helix transcriptional regulator [Paracoccaceae bacterium]MBR9819527.1 helix-turn-helix transcriptional regulator [Paracoccaceae bacterium]
MHDSVVGRLYDVAVDPLRLADLLDDWERLNRPLRRALDRAMSLDQATSPPRPSEARRAVSLDFTDHFQRVTRLLEQTRAAHALRPEEAELRRFARTAAFAVGPDMRLAAANEAARHGLGVGRGDRLAALPFEARHLEALRGRIRRMLGQTADPAPERARRPAARPGREATLRLRLADSGQLILAQLALNRPGAGEAPFVLVVTSQLRWPEALTETLRDAFRLTRAEAEILRSLSEARPLREIAEDRGRSVETVRAQIKAILAKTETRSQGELLRLALSVSELIPALLGPAAELASPQAATAAPSVAAPSASGQRQAKQPSGTPPRSQRQGAFAQPVTASALAGALGGDHRGDRPRMHPRPTPGLARRAGRSGRPPGPPAASCASAIAEACCRCAPSAAWHAPTGGGWSISASAPLRAG